MTATKRITVREEVRAALSNMRELGMTFSELLEEMIEHENKRRLVEDIKLHLERARRPPAQVGGGIARNKPCTLSPRGSYLIDR